MIRTYIQMQALKQIPIKQPENKRHQKLVKNE